MLHRPPNAGYFALRPVRPQDLPWIMRRHIITGCLGTIWGTLTGGIVFTWFGNAVGMSRFAWGIMGAVGAWMVLAQPLGALLAARTGSRKVVFWWFTLGERLLRLSAIVGASLAWRAGLPTAWVVLVALVSASGLMVNVATAPWLAWLAAIVPPGVQGSFWGRRDTWTSVAVIAVLTPATFLLDRIAPGAKMSSVLAILVAAGAIGIVDILWHGTIPEPPMASERAGAPLQRIAAPLRDRRFRPWLLFTASWNFSMALGGSLCVLYFLDNLGLKNNLFGGAIALNVVGLTGSVLTARRMGRLVDRWGSRRVLLVGHLFWSLLPALWLFATPRTAVLWIGMGGLIGGVFSTAATNAALKLVTRFPPPEQGAMYIAVSSAVANVAGGLGALAAGAFLQAMGGWTARLGGLLLSPYPLLFVVSFALRAASTLVLVPRIREQGVREEERPLLLPLFFGLPVKRRRG